MANIECFFTRNKMFYHVEIFFFTEGINHNTRINQDVIKPMAIVEHEKGIYRNLYFDRDFFS